MTLVVKVLELAADAGAGANALRLRVSDGTGAADVKAFVGADEGVSWAWLGLI